MLRSAMLSVAGQGEALYSRRMPIAVDDQAREFEEFHSWRAGWRDGVHARPHQDRFARHKTRDDIKLAYMQGYDEGHALRLKSEREAMSRIGYKPTVLRNAKLDPVVDHDLKQFEQSDTGRFATRVPGSGQFPKTEAE